MAETHYSGDSPSPSHLSAPSSFSGSPEIIVTTVPFRVGPNSEKPSLPAPYILGVGLTTYVGETADCWRRMRDRGTSDTLPLPDRGSPSIISTLD
ncbi:hypothetical protein ACVWWK_002659 [Bradyrhizobium sp. LB9.1b]